MQDFLENEIILSDMEEIFLTRNSWADITSSSFYITGASGMIASYMVMYLIYLNERRYYNIQIFAGIRNRQKAISKFGDYCSRPYFHIIEDDVVATVNPIIKADYVVHAASLASPQFYGKMPVETMLPNVVGTYNLLEWSKIQTIKGFLFFSSGSVYGSVKDVDVITEDNAGPLQFLSNGNSYGESKRCGEALCHAYASEYKVPTRSARIHHTYGPTMDIVNDKRVFSEFVSNVVNNQDIVLKSDGKAHRAFCYITDTLSALFAILLNGENGESYNIANDNEYISVRELAEIIVKLSNDKSIKVKVQTRNEDGYCPSPENRLLPVCVDKTRKLGWQPKISVSEGFYRVIYYYQKNKLSLYNKDNMRKKSFNQLYIP